MNVLTAMVDVMNDLVVNTSTTVELGKPERDFVFAVARRIVDSEDAADDVAQEALLLAHRHRDSFRGDAKYRTWLYRIAATAALGHLRKRRRSRELLARSDEPFAHEVADPRPSPEAVVADHEATGLARRLIDELDPKYREVLELRVDHSEGETAARLGISVANVKVRAHRARAQLHAAFGRAPANDERATRP